jgi:hypothetical protein
MRVSGACHCGRIAFEAEVEPGSVAVCHCTDCQKLTGSAFRANIPAPAATFRLLRGEPRIYVKTADSGARRAHAFCADCGTPIYATAAQGERTSYSLRIGTLDERRALGAPARQIWRASGLSWSTDLRDVAARDGQ